MGVENGVHSAAASELHRRARDRRRRSPTDRHGAVDRRRSRPLREDRRIERNPRHRQGLLAVLLRPPQHPFHRRDTSRGNGVRRGIERRTCEAARLSWRVGRANVHGERQGSGPHEPRAPCPRVAVPIAGAVRLHRQGIRAWCWNVAMGRSGNGSRGQIGGGDPEALLPGDRYHEPRRRLARIAVVAVLAAASWLIAFVTWSTEPAGYDFVALYAAARLVATGHGAQVTDPAALFAAEDAAPPRAVFDDPIRLSKTLPALAAVMAPLGALPIQAAYAVMLTFSVLALICAALLLGPLAAREQRGRAFAFALLAPTSLIALVEGQTSPFVLLCVAASLRAPPVWSGALLGLLALRPQLLPLFALVAITERRRATGLVAAAGIVILISFLIAGVEGMAH